MTSCENALAPCTATPWSAVQVVTTLLEHRALPAGNAGHLGRERLQAAQASGRLGQLVLSSASCRHGGSVQRTNSLDGPCQRRHMTLEEKGASGRAQPSVRRGTSSPSAAFSGPERAVADEQR